MQRQHVFQFVVLSFVIAVSAVFAFSGATKPTIQAEEATEYDLTDIMLYVKEDNTAGHAYLTFGNVSLTCNQPQCGNVWVEQDNDSRIQSVTLTWENCDGDVSITGSPSPIWDYPSMVGWTTKSEPLTQYAINTLQTVRELCSLTGYHLETGAPRPWESAS